MNKVIVIGCPGSGKSVFSRELHFLTSLPLTHLDNLYWNKDGTTISKEEFMTRLCRALDYDTWIIDGNYNSTMELRMSRCDTVFFFDLPCEVCLDGIISRIGKPRPDIPWVEEEVDAEFRLFVERYNVDTRPAVIALLEKYSAKNIVIFKSREDSIEYLEKIKNELL